jgi:hypothetical protein
MQGVQILNEFMHEEAIVAPWCQIGLGCSIIGLVVLMFSPKGRLGNWGFCPRSCFTLFWYGSGYFCSKRINTSLSSHCQR